MLNMTPGHLVKMLLYLPNRKAVNREKTARVDGPFQVDFMKRANPGSATGRQGASALSGRGQGGWLTRGTLLPPIEQRDCRPVRARAIRMPSPGRRRASTPI